MSLCEGCGNVLHGDGCACHLAVPELRVENAKLRDDNEKLRTQVSGLQQEFADFKEVTQEIVDAAMNENMPRLRAATKAYQSLQQQTLKPKCAPACCKRPAEIGLVCICDCHLEDGTIEKALKPMSDLIDSLKPKCICQKQPCEFCKPGMATYIGDQR